MNAEEVIKSLKEGFEKNEKCVALAIAGSKTSLINDEFSDWDLYVYYKAHISKEERDEIILPLADRAIMNGSFFEEGDEFSRDGNCFDLMYRPVDFVEDEINKRWYEHKAQLGYSTCFLYNFKTSTFLFDKAGLEEKIAVLNEPYPDELADNIIKDNLTMAMGESEANWLAQIKNAERRHDLPSRNHRLAAFMASYFDILFAHNRVLHPGEKKLVGYAHALCKELPRDFDEDIDRIYSRAYEGDLSQAVDIALTHLCELTGHI